MNKINCLKCREFTEMRDVKQKTTKNNRQMLQRICVVCGTKKSKFIRGQLITMTFVMLKTKTQKHEMKCDRKMLQELNGIYNSTLRERIERGVVSTIIGTKKRFGWGLKKRAQREHQLEFAVS